MTLSQGAPGTSQCASGIVRVTGVARPDSLTAFATAGKTWVLATALLAPGGGLPGQSPPTLCSVQSEPFISVAGTTYPSNGGEPLMPPTVKPKRTQTRARLTEDLFQAMVSEWTLGAGPTSSSTEIAAHPAFRRIVSSGRDAIPFLLRELKKEPSLLVLALHEITGENPVAREARGKIKEMARAWIAWGEKSGLLR